MNEKLEGFDRVLELHRLEREVGVSWWAVEESQRRAQQAAAELGQALERHRAVQELTGDLGQELKQHGRGLEAAGGLERLLELHRVAQEDAAKLGPALERHRKALEAAGGLGRLLELHRIAQETAGEFSHVITTEPGKRNGQPCLRGIRMTVYDVLEYLTSGMSVGEILDDFPDLTPEDLEVCRAFGAVLEGRLKSLPAP